MKRMVFVLLCVLMALAAFAACAAPQAAEETPEAGETAEVEETPVAEETAAQEQEGGAAEEASDVASATLVVTDMLGAELELEPVPDGKIVSLTPAGTEIVCELQGEDRLVGVDAYSDYPESIQGVEIVGDFNGPDVEKIVSLEPDYILAGTSLQQDAIDSLKSLGMQVVSVEATTFDQIPESIRLIGTIMGRDDLAGELIGTMDEAIKSVEEAAPAEEKTVYYAMSYGEAGNWTSGPGSFINDMIAIAGGKSVTDDDPSLPAWVEYPVEDLVAADPDIILVDESMGAVGNLAEQNGFKDLDAVKNGKTYGIDADIFTRPGPRVVVALAQMSEILNEQ